MTENHDSNLMQQNDALRQGWKGEERNHFIVQFAALTVEKNVIGKAGTTIIAYIPQFSPYFSYAETSNIEQELNIAPAKLFFFQTIKVNKEQELLLDISIANMNFNFLPCRNLSPLSLSKVIFQ